MENVGQLYDEIIKIINRFNYEHKKDVSLITLDYMYSLECIADSTEWKDGKTMPTKVNLGVLAELCWELVSDFDCDVAPDTVARVVIQAYEDSKFNSVNEFVRKVDRNQLEDDLSYCL